MDQASRTKRFLTLTGGALTALTLVTASGGAAAQNTVLNRFDQPVAGDTFTSVFGPSVSGHLVPRVALTYDYGHRPFILKDANDATIGYLSRSQSFVHGGVSLALWNRILLSIDMPFAVSQRGDVLKTSTYQITGTRGRALGELRAGARVRLYGESTSPFSLAVGGFVYAPTANDPWTGENYVYGEPQLLLGGRIPHFTYAAFGGVKIRGKNDPTSVTFGAGAAATFLDHALMFGPEVRGSWDIHRVDLVDNILAREERTGAEVRFGAQLRLFKSIVVGGSGGIGVTTAVGTPEVRALARLAFDPPAGPGPSDQDKDGIDDGSDACPTVPGVASSDPKKHGCPPPDKDGDGITDAKDACVDVAGIRSADPKKNGCPDGDGDGFIDSADACPAAAGTEPDGCPDTDGDGIKDPVDQCPTAAGKAPTGCPDADGDSIRDSDDACPTDPGQPSSDPTKNGCPKAIVTAKEIVITETIEFELGKATLLPASTPIIEAVAGILKDNDDIQQIEVQGHTDDIGSSVLNLRLSKDRAESVTAAIVAKGIDAKRLLARGYGSLKPLERAKTDAARAKNRRVQFVILKRDLAAAKAKDEARAAAKAAAEEALRRNEASAAPAPAAPAPAAPAPAAPAPAAPAPAAPAPAAPAPAPVKK